MSFKKLKKSSAPVKAGMFKMKKCLAVFLAFVLFCSALSSLKGLSISDTGEIEYSTAYAANPSSETLLRSILFVQSSVNKLGEKSGLSDLLGKVSEFNTVMGLYSNVNSILKMMGIIEDGQAAQMREILKEVNGLHDAANELNGKIDDLNEKVTAVRSKQEEDSRENRARSYYLTWEKFEEDYITKLDNLMQEYAQKMIYQFQNWRNLADSTDTTAVDNAFDDLYLYYYKYQYQDEDGMVKEKTEVYATWGDALSEKNEPSSEEGEIVESKTMKLSESALRKLANDTDYNVNKYYNDLTNGIKKLFTDQNIGTDKESMIQVTPEWEKEFDTADSEKKDKMVQEAAEALFSCLAARLSRTLVHNEKELMTNLQNLYSGYCSGLSEKGIQAQLTMIKNSYCFEREARLHINNALGSLNARTTAYNTFALTLMKQGTEAASWKSGTTSHYAFVKSDKMDEILQKSIKANNTITQYNEQTLTGCSNYCYLYDQVVEFTTFDVAFQTTLEGTFRKDVTFVPDRYVYQKASVDCSASQSINTPYVSTVYAKVILDHYKSQRDSGLTKASSFTDYLKKMGIELGDFTGSVITGYNGKGWEDYDLSQNILMNRIGKSEKATNSVNYFSDLTALKVFDLHGNNYEGKATKEYFTEHQKVTGDLLNLKDDGATETNQTLAAVAVYAESHWQWISDEVWSFANATSTDPPESLIDGHTVTDTFKYKTPYGLLKLVSLEEALAKKKGSSQVQAVEEGSGLFSNTVYAADEAVCTMAELETGTIYSDTSLETEGTFCFGHGSVQYCIDSEESLPVQTFAMDEYDLMQELLSDTSLAAVYGNDTKGSAKLADITHQHGDLTLSVSRIDASESQQTIIRRASGSDSIVLTMQMNTVLNSDDSTADSLTANTDPDLDLQLTMTEDMKAGSKTYVMVGYNDGKAEVLESKTDRTQGTITYNTAGYTHIALCAQDNPLTGIDFMSSVPAAAALICCAALLGVILILRRKTN